MKLTTKGRYAVMALADLAQFDNTGPVSLRDISLRQGISLLYLEQIFSKLKKNDIVKYGETLQKCLVGHTSSALFRTDEASSYWAVWLPGFGYEDFCFLVVFFFSCGVLKQIH